jgi:heme exporter protein D
VVKVFLYPLIGILHLAVAANTVFSFNGELGITVAGLVAGALIGVVYFAPPTALVLYAARRKKETLALGSLLKPVSMLWLLGASLILVGELVASEFLMMAATGLFVSSTVAITATAVALKILNVQRKATASLLSKGRASNRRG